MEQVSAVWRLDRNRAEDGPRVRVQRVEKDPRLDAVFVERRARHVKRPVRGEPQRCPSDAGVALERRGARRVDGVDGVGEGNFVEARAEQYVGSRLHRQVGDRTCGAAGCDPVGKPDLRPAGWIDDDERARTPRRTGRRKRATDGRAVESARRIKREPRQSCDRVGVTNDRACARRLVDGDEVPRRTDG